MSDWKKLAITWMVSILVGFYSVFVLMEMWNWFPVPLLHVSESSYWLMYGVSMLFGLNASKLPLKTSAMLALAQRNRASDGVPPRLTEVKIDWCVPSIVGNNNPLQCQHQSDKDTVRVGE